ncbi:hypothetical protein [Nocardia sp. NPDC057227]|uniref:hypothetical protein n=1 Tax=Nocardia sp. NPDC057227 TaxID=3346056 RepID=UPI0036250C0D
MNDNIPRLGIDFGRVVMGAAAESGAADTVFLDGSHADAMRTPPEPHAFEVLARLVARFEQRAWLISKCGPRIEARTREWLAHNDFHARTGVPDGNLRFCRARPEKAVHCRELGITHMIDDRLDVHRALRGLVPHLYLYGHRREPAPDWVTHTPTWPDVEAALTL